MIACRNERCVDCRLCYEQSYSKFPSQGLRLKLTERELVVAELSTNHGFVYRPKLGALGPGRSSQDSDLPDMLL